MASKIQFFYTRLSKHPRTAIECTKHNTLPHFLTSLISRLLGLALVSWATARVGVHHFFPSPSTSRCFYIHFFTCHRISFVFLLYDRRICTHSIDSSLLLMVTFQTWGWLWYSMLWSQRRSMG